MALRTSELIHTIPKALRTAELIQSQRRSEQLNSFTQSQRRSEQLNSFTQSQFSINNTMHFCVPIIPSINLETKKHYCTTKMKLLTSITVFSIFCSLLYLGNSAPHEPVAPVPINELIAKIVPQIQLLLLSNYLIDYAHLHGGVFIDRQNPHQFVKNAEGKPILNAKNLSNHFSVTQPMTLFPSPYPAELFKQAQQMEPLMAELHLRVSRNYKFISDAMRLTAKADPEFIGQLVKIMDAVHNDRRQSGMTLIFERSDYLTHLEEHGAGHKTINLKQIESTGGNNAGQGDFDVANKLHKRELQKFRYLNHANIPAWLRDLQVEGNEVLKEQAKALFKTWLRFSEMHADPRAVILLISAPKRRYHSHYEKLNFAQYHLEDYAMEYEKQRKQQGEDTAGKYKPHLVQITIKECAERLVLTKDRHLMLRNEMGEDRRVAIAYFMDGYLPEHFQSPAEWKARLEMEQSEAVIQPNIFVYFAGTKTIQQALTEPGAMESFFPEAKADTEEGRRLAKKLAALRATFIEQWGLGTGSAKEEAEVKRAIANPGQYVLKCNRQGGKGNYFDADLREELERLTVEQRGEYILQRKIEPFYVKNLILPIAPQPETQLDIVDVNTELSIYGSLLARTLTKEEMAAAKNGGHRLVNGDQLIIFNNVDGYGARTKILSNTMCNLSGGKGGADSLVLFPISSFHAKSQSDESKNGVGKSCAAAGEQFSFETPAASGQQSAAAAAVVKTEDSESEEQKNV